MISISHCHSRFCIETGVTLVK